MKKPNVENLTYDLLKAIGEDPERQGLKKTPRRVKEAYKYLTQGYRQNVKEILNGAVFDEQYDEIVVVKDIDVFSLCEHHLLPFYGKCHVAYLPKGRIIGLSKIPRLVDMFARRLQVQERMTQQIANSLKEALQPLGVAVIIEATHLCMAMRGVEKQNATCVTSTMLGVFRSDRGTRMEFMDLVKSRR
jgi:GTP cyclohydrolase I